MLFIGDMFHQWGFNIVNRGMIDNMRIGAWCHVIINIVNISTIKRDWTFAKSWLFDQLKPVETKG